MNSRFLVRLSNIIGVASIILLVYWVFVFISTKVFGLKVFRENISETFGVSILAILALMTGALMINVMFNLTRIAEKHNQDQMSTEKVRRWIVPAVLISLPLILGLLFAGDYLSSKKREEMLISSAQSIVELSPEKMQFLLDYRFNERWMIKAAEILQLYSATDEEFPYVTMIVRDTVDGLPVFIGFRQYHGVLDDMIDPRKVDFVEQTSKAERDYLDDVFTRGKTEVRFSAHDGHYELYYPVIKADKKLVLYFSKYQRYGKIGS